MVISFLKDVLSKPKKVPTHEEALEQVRESLRRGETEMAMRVSDHSFADFETVTGEVANEAAFDAKISVAKKLLTAFENSPQDHPNEFNKFGKSIQYCTDALEGFVGLKQAQKSEECVQTLARMSISPYFNHRNFLDRVTQSPQSAGMVTMLNKNNILVGAEHTDLILEKNQDEDFKISFLKKNIKNINDKELPAFLEELARTDGHTQTKLQAWALSEYMRECDSRITIPFILSEIQVGSVETAKKVFPDYQSLADFTVDLFHNEMSTHRRMDDIILNDVIPEECVGKRAAEINNHISKLVLDHVKLGYLSAGENDIDQAISYTHNKARLTAALASRVLQDESAGHDAQMIAANRIKELIITEDKMAKKIEKVDLSRLDQHEAYQDLRKTEDWQRYKDLQYWNRDEGSEIAGYVRKIVNPDNPYDKRCLELLENGISVYGLRPAEKEELAILHDKITQADAANPHICDNLTASEIEEYGIYIHATGEVETLSKLERIKKEEGKVGYGRAAVESLSYNGDERTIKLLTSHKLLTKEEKPAPRFTDMQGQSLKL